jgi:predicted dehydrogenase
MIDCALVVGLGSIGKRHLRLLRAALPNADIRVLRHSGCEGAIEHADGCFDRLEEACSFAPQLAVIATPAPFHLPVATSLAQAGAHLLVEKPIADGAAGVADLVTLCSNQRRQLQIGYNLRFLGTLQRFRTEVAEGTIGPVRIVRCEVGQYLPSWRPGADYREAASARRELGGGVLLELSHELDMLRWVFGEVEWVSAWTGRQGPLEIDVEDSVMIQMGFTGGQVAQLNMDFLRRDTTRVCTAIGDLGSLRWDAVTGSVARFASDTSAWNELLSTPPERDATYAAQIDALLASIDSGNPDGIAARGADGLAVMQLIDAVRASEADEGRRTVLRTRAWE